MSLLLIKYINRPLNFERVKKRQILFSLIYIVNVVDFCIHSPVKIKNILIFHFNVKPLLFLRYLN